MPESTTDCKFHKATRCDGDPGELWVPTAWVQANIVGAGFIKDSVCYEVCADASKLPEAATVYTPTESTTGCADSSCEPDCTSGTPCGGCGSSVTPNAWSVLVKSTVNWFFGCQNCQGQEAGSYNIVSQAPLGDALLSQHVSGCLWLYNYWISDFAQRYPAANCQSPSSSSGLPHQYEVRINSGVITLKIWSTLGDDAYCEGDEGGIMFFDQQPLKSAGCATYYDFTNRIQGPPGKQTVVDDTGSLTILAGGGSFRIIPCDVFPP